MKVSSTLMGGAFMPTATPQVTLAATAVSVHLFQPGCAGPDDRGHGIANVKCNVFVTDFSCFCQIIDVTLQRGINVPLCMCRGDAKRKNKVIRL